MLRDEQKAQEALMKDKPFRERLSYFIEYHKFSISAVTIGIILISWVLYAVITFSTENLYVMITDQQGDTLNTDMLTEAWKTYHQDLSISSDQILPVVYTTDLELANITLNNITVEDLQKVLALYNANTLDVMIAPEAVFQYYGSEGMFQSLDQLLSPEEISALTASDSFFSVTLKETGTEIPVAIRIPQHPLVSQSGMHIDDVCIGLTVKRSHPEQAEAFLHMFLRSLPWDS